MYGCLDAFSDAGCIAPIMATGFRFGGTGGKMFMNFYTERLFLRGTKIVKSKYHERMVMRLNAQMDNVKFKRE